MQYKSVLELYRSVAEGYGSLSLAAKGAIIVALAVLTTALGTAVVVWLPADHFTPTPGPITWWRRHPLVRWTVVGLKNVLGALVLSLGVVMALPLVPGPGVVFIAIGLSLVDFPGKRSLEKRLLGRPSVIQFLNDVRGRFGRPPLILE